MSYVAATGDSGWGVSWPAVLPGVAGRRHAAGLERQHAQRTIAGRRPAATSAPGSRCRLPEVLAIRCPRTQQGAWRTITGSGAAPNHVWRVSRKPAAPGTVELHRGEASADPEGSSGEAPAEADRAQQPDGGGSEPEVRSIPTPLGSFMPGSSLQVAPVAAARRQATTWPGSSALFPAACTAPAPAGTCPIFASPRADLFRWRRSTNPLKPMRSPRRVLLAAAGFFTAWAVLAALGGLSSSPASRRAADWREPDLVVLEVRRTMWWPLISFGCAARGLHQFLQRPACCRGSGARVRSSPTTSARWRSGSWW